ncbi:hypothetical protein CCP3SC5AM1_910001 [Gammaproteobacteria bacterium]
MKYSILVDKEITYFTIEGMMKHHAKIMNSTAKTKQYSWKFRRIYLVGLTILPTAQAIESNSYTVVDTGQTKCYNASNEITCPSPEITFYGQDAQFSRDIPNYTLSENGALVYDNVTGLTWQRGPDKNQDGALTSADKLNYPNSVAHCAALGSENYQGFNDWRLPSIKELYSLIDFRGVDPNPTTDMQALTPFIDRTFFNFAYGDQNAGERIIDSQYASSTLYVDKSVSVRGDGLLFGVNFADGRIKGYDLTTPGGIEKTFFVQCVRGNKNYGVNSFVDNGDQTITDNATGLMWSKLDSGVALNWQEALAWTQTKNTAYYLGYQDWRLPNAKELQSILDYTRSPATTGSAAINPIFNATELKNESGQSDWPWYWASTTFANGNGLGDEGIYFAFGRALGWIKRNATDTCYTLQDVHGAGAQRSDPKTHSGLMSLGAACGGGTAYGHGPQGDVQRAANYVRLVRNVATTAATSSDFTVTQVALTPTAPGANSSFTALVTVKNQGTTPGDGGKLAVWSHQATVQNCNATGDQTIAVGSLAAGESKIFSVTGLSAGVAGKKTLRAFIDSACLTSESNERNNQFTQIYTVSGGQADVTITDISLLTASPRVNSLFSAIITIKNQGIIATTSSRLAIWTNQSTEQGCNATAPDRIITMAGLAAGASRPITVTGLLAGNAGVKTFRAFIDSGCVISESSETNNQASKSYKVLSPPQPDFVINALALGTSPGANTTFSVTITVKNQGENSGNGGNLAIWAHQPMAQNCKATPDKNVALGFMAAGAVKTMTVIGLPAKTAGTKTLRAFVDAACTTVESNEDNNQLAKSYQVISR